MTTALLWVAPFLILAGCVAYAWCVLAGHERPGCLRRTIATRAARALLTAAIAVLSLRPARTVTLRARWAWRCRGRPPVRDEGGPRPTVEEVRVLGNLDAGRDVRART